MKKFLLVLMTIALVCVGTMVSCSSSGGDSGEFAGTWLATGEDSGVGKAVLFEMVSSSFTRIAYTEEPDDMIQEEGQKGQYGISGNNFTVTVTSEWDEGTSSWGTGIESVVIPYTYDGSTLTLEVEPGLMVPFSRIVFSQHANLSGTSWANGELELNSTGTYTYDDGADYTASGTWSATANKLRTITTVENGSSMYVENLYEYDIVGSELVLSWDGDEKLRY